MDDEELYQRIGMAAAVLGALATFLGAWVYCAATYGFLFGFGLGWLPAAILAALVALVLRFAWPVLLGVVPLGLFLGWF
ncbi:MAG TPA: hypothetical protein VF759_10100 [Allosphingosinicella sp.]|jgi:hypothetical protein